jgi:predicted metal-dependent hydrolase
MKFEYPDELNPAWNPRFPEFACAANSISLLMPYAEPYFVHSVRSALPDLDDELRAQTKDYLGQETQHYLQHRRFNDIIGARYPRIPRVEGWIGKTYGWLDRTRSQRFNIAFAAASETIAFGIARWTEANLGKLFDGADSEASTLYLWHLAEEVEHKSAAFDVYEAVDGSRLRYAWAMWISLMILVWFTTMTTIIMVIGERRWYSPVAWFRLLVWAFSLAFSLLPLIASSTLPSHHPSSFADPVYLPTWLKQFDPETGTMPVWRAA